MNDPVARVVEPFLAAADAVFDGRYSAVLYGSAARGDYAPKDSDVNLMLLVDDVSPPALRALGPGFKDWRKTAWQPPLLMTRVEWARATDVFPIEIADMRTAYRVLRGADPLRELHVDPGDLRRALEREFRGKLVRLRQSYAALASDPEALGTAAAGTASSVLVLFRALHVLLGRPVPPDPVELVRTAAVSLGVDGEAFVQVVQHRRESRWRCSAPVFEGYMLAVAQAAGFLDQLHLGGA